MHLPEKELHRSSSSVLHKEDPEGMWVDMQDWKERSLGSCILSAIQQEGDYSLSQILL